MNISLTIHYSSISLQTLSSLSLLFFYLYFCVSLYCALSFPLYFLLFAFFGMCYFDTTGELLVSSDTCTTIFMMKIDFWSFRHYSCQLFSNKCDCVRQVNLINAETTITLSRDIGFISFFPHCCNYQFIKKMWIINNLMNYWSLGNIYTPNYHTIWLFLAGVQI